MILADNNTLIESFQLSQNLGETGLTHCAIVFDPLTSMSQTALRMAGGNAFLSPEANDSTKKIIMIPIDLPTKVLLVRQFECHRWHSILLVTAMASLQPLAVRRARFLAFGITDVH